VQSLLTKELSFAWSFYKFHFFCSCSEFRATLDRPDNFFRLLLFDFRRFLLCFRIIIAILNTLKALLVLLVWPFLIIIFGFDSLFNIAKTLPILLQLYLSLLSLALIDPLCKDIHFFHQACQFCLVGYFADTTREDCLTHGSLKLNLNCFLVIAERAVENFFHLRWCCLHDLSLPRLTFPHWLFYILLFNIIKSKV